MRLLLVLFLVLVQSVAWADKFDGTLDVFESAPELKPFFEDAYAYAVFPTVGKGGFMIGGSYGKGQVYQNDKIVGKSTLTQVSLGFQMGGQAFSEIVFLQDRRAFDEFVGGRVEFGATASAVVITLGAHAQAGTTVMYEASIGGQKFSYQSLEQLAPPAEAI
jgi:lipid-binding SYLF domain-containing protein